MIASYALRLRTFDPHGSQLGYRPRYPYGTDSQKFIDVVPRSGHDSDVGIEPGVQPTCSRLREPCTRRWGEQLPLGRKTLYPD